MNTISLCMIVKDEETQLANCLSSVSDLVDEIIVTDTGSSDSTKEIAKGYTDKVFEFPWVDDFSAARNFSFAHASMDYILWLDADDVLLPEDQDKLKELKEDLDPNVDAVMMRYHTAFDANGEVTFSYYRERMVKRARQFRWKEPVHEYIEIGGNILHSDIAVTHQKMKDSSSYRNLAIYKRILDSGEALSPRGLYYYARELKDHAQFREAIRFFNLFLDGDKGWVEDNITACAELAVCYQHENLRQEQLRALARSFIYDTPRAEVCCALGYAWKAVGDFKRAAFWFRLATTLEKPENSWGFVQEECWGYVPYIELAVCYDKLGSPQIAEQFNEMAGKFKPGDRSVQYNRDYFQSLKLREESSE